MSSTITPNMSLIVPGVGNEAGPQYANDINNSLTIIDQHDHSSGSGVQITPSGLNISSDLTMSSNNLVAVRSVRFTAQGAPLALAADLGCLYESGVDLYYNDGSGNQIRITQSGAVSGAAGTITGLPSGTASATYGAGTFVFQSATSTAANIDGASFILRNSTASSKGLTLQPPNAMAADYAITLPSIPAQTNVLNIDTSGNMGSMTYDAVAQAMSSTGANAIASTMTSTGANALASTMTSTGANTIATKMTRATGTSVAVNGVAISASCGAFSTASTSAIPVTNLSVTITTSGRPVHIGLVPDGAGGIGEVRVGTGGSLSSPGQIVFARDGTIISLSGVYGDPVVSSPPGGFNYIDTPAAGTHTYAVSAAAPVSLTPSILVNFIKLIVYEL